MACYTGSFIVIISTHEADLKHILLIMGGVMSYRVLQYLLYLLSEYIKGRISEINNLKYLYFVVDETLISIIVVRS